METHDFTAAKVGDKVSHPIYGCGMVKAINKASDYPIYVSFKLELELISFSFDGKAYDTDTIPTLYHGHNTFQIIATPVSPYKEGEWIAVSMKETIVPELRKFIKMGQHGVFCETCDDPSKSWEWKYHKSLNELNAELNNK